MVIGGNVSVCHILFAESSKTTFFKRVQPALRETRLKATDFLDVLLPNYHYHHQPYHHERHCCHAVITNIIITNIFSTIRISTITFISIMIDTITNFPITVILISHCTCPSILSCRNHNDSMCQQIWLISTEKYFKHFFFKNCLFYLENGFNLNLLLVLLRVSQKGRKSLTYPI